MKRLTSVILFLTLFAGGAVVAAKKDEAWQIDKRDFKKTYKVIALMPVDAAPYLDMPEHVARMIEDEVTGRLQKRGYTVLPSSVLAGIREEMTRHVGGTTDPETGNTDFAKLQAVHEHALREFWFRHDFDAIASMRVVIHAVAMESDRVEWDGAKAKLDYEGRSKKYSAEVNVSSVSVAVYDSRSAPLYLYFGGLEPIMWRDGEQLQPLEADKLFLDEKRIRKAAQIAVSPI